MLHREIIAVCSQIHTKHTNTLCWQNVELLNVKLVVHIVTAGLYRPETHPEHAIRCKIKVKCTLVQALRLCTGRTAHRGSRGIALPFLDHGTRRG